DQDRDEKLPRPALKQGNPDIKRSVLGGGTPNRPVTGQGHPDPGRELSCRHSNFHRIPFFPQTRRETIQGNALIPSLPAWIAFSFTCSNERCSRSGSTSRTMDRLAPPMTQARSHSLEINALTLNGVPPTRSAKNRIPVTAPNPETAALNFFSRSSSESRRSKETPAIFGCLPAIISTELFSAVAKAPCPTRTIPIKGDPPICSLRL